MTTPPAPLRNPLAIMPCGWADAIRMRHTGPRRRWNFCST